MFTNNVDSYIHLNKLNKSEVNDNDINIMTVEYCFFVITKDNVTFTTNIYTQEITKHLVLNFIFD